ncbi:MAG: phage tail tube protein [Planctomycetota bacterium]
MGATDFSELRMARQRPLDTSGSALGDEATIARQTGETVTVAESNGTITITGLANADYDAQQVVRISGGTSVAGLNDDFVVKADRTTGPLTLETPAGKEGIAGGDTIDIGSLLVMQETGEGFGAEFESSESEIKVPVRGTQDLVRQAARARGSISSELSFPNFTHVMDAAFQNPWERSGDGQSNVVATNVTTTVSAAARTLAGTGIEANINPRDCVRIEGGANDGAVVIVTAIAPNLLTVTGDVLVDSNSAISLRKADRMVPGSSIRPYTVERRYSDGQILEVGAPRCIGMAPDTFSFSGGRSGQITVESGWLGAREVSPTPTSLIGVSAGRSVGDVLTVSSNAQLWISGVSTGCTTGFTLNYANNLFEQNCWGSGLEATEITTRTLSVSGSFSRFYSSKTAYDRFLADNDETLVVTLKDPESGKVRVFDLPRVKYADAGRAAGARNNDIEFSANFSALISEDVDATVVMWGFDS